MPSALTPKIYSRDLAPRPAWLRAWERHRHTSMHWLVELFAEMGGVFCYVYAGVGATATFVTMSILEQPGLGSLFNIGFGYAMGILIALVTCAATSGGHFNPAVSITLVLYRGFPPLKALRYIVAQILGGYIACMLIYAQYKDLIKESEAALLKAGKLDALLFTPSGPAGIFAIYVLPTANLSRVLLNEFVTDTFIGLTIWSALDHTNFFAPPQAAPWIISFAYAVAVWGFSTVGVATNAARDLGGRFAALTIYGMDASGGKYAAITALTSIPATIFAATLYELFLADSSRVLPAQHVDFVVGHAHHLKQRGVNTPAHALPVLEMDDKSHEETYEHSPDPNSPDLSRKAHV